MSFNRQNYDENAYLHSLRESVGAGEYRLNMPRNDCDTCFFTSPYVRVNTMGASVCKKNPIDVDSELMGLTRKNSHCPTKQYIPQPNDFCVTSPLRDCDTLGSQDSRLTNPPCTLRGTGWNRWEWLCQNPQDKAIVPFPYLINNSLVVKDNHRPQVCRPMDPVPGLPSAIETMMDCAEPLPPNCGPLTEQPFPARQDIPSTQWRSAAAIKQINDGCYPC